MAICDMNVYVQYTYDGWLGDIDFEIECVSFDIRRDAACRAKDKRLFYNTTIYSFAILL